MDYKITKWTKHVTDDKQDKTICAKPKELNFKFRLLDDDGFVYAYGYSNDDSSEEAFRPLDEIGSQYGCTEIQYKNPKTGEYETL